MQSVWLSRAVSRGEGGQQKQLLVLDEHFGQVDAVNLDIGPRHFASDVLPVADGAPASLPADLRRGDRCRLSVAGKETLSHQSAEQQPAVLLKT